MSEEVFLVFGEVLDDAHVGAWSALQRLVAGEDTFPSAQVFEVVVVELVRRFDVQVLQRGIDCSIGSVTGFNQGVAKRGVDVGICR